MALNDSYTALPNSGTHAWLHCIERNQQLRIGDLGNYPLPKPAEVFLIKIEQRLGFDCEPRAFWHPAKNGNSAKLEWSDLGVFAPLGLLPEHLSETLMQTSSGASVRQLISDLLQRLIHLYYRSWAQLRPECEIGRSDDRFSALLSVLAGAPVTNVPHLPGHCPPLHQLPQLALTLFGISVRVEYSMVNRMRQPNPLLGAARLSRSRLGQHVYVFALGNVRLWIQPGCAEQFFVWHNQRHPNRLRLGQFLQQFLPVGAHCDIRVQAPPGMPRASLAQSKLAHSFL